ncbi:diguanylate cyclase [Zobellella aerophila]|uniref:diguanylate cyclase n=1 Tax=Zobellella aerophila TaxID=870480 RepID=A0ABP6V5P0_9GAMM
MTDANSELRQELERLRSLEKTLHMALDMVSDGIWDWDRVTGVVKRNAHWYRMLGYEPFSLPETVDTWLQLIHPDDYDGTVSRMQRYLDGQAELFSARYRFKKADGHYIWLHDRAKFVAFDGQGNPIRMLGAHHDIQQQVQAEQEQRNYQARLEQLNRELEAKVEARTRELAEANAALTRQVSLYSRQAQTDYLTGLFNRRYFEHLIGEHRIMPPRQECAIVLLDLDRFKEVNDRYGHPVGDLVLQAIPSLLKSHLRNQDVLARWGGEEFIVWLPETSKTNALQISERLRLALEQARFCHDIRLTGSFGIADCRPGDDIHHAIEKADSCLYLAKQMRNRVICT